MLECILMGMDIENGTIRYSGRDSGIIIFMVEIKMDLSTFSRLGGIATR